MDPSPAVRSALTVPRLRAAAHLTAVPVAVVAGGRP